MKDKNRLSLLIWFRLARFYQESNQLSHLHLRKFSISVSQFDVLVQIMTHQPISQKELGAKLLVTKGGVTQMLARLEKDGLIERSQTWRTKLISLTDSGQKILNLSLPEQSDFQASMFDCLDEEEKKQFLNTLRKLNQHIQKKTLE
ncbi:MarR family transcriptional regulator [Bacillus sp. IBL03825]|nr:MarR family transcriptional regulator [Bacillus sp. IBL03825]MCR6850453.1 MarR family transcriptional regulator [Bacillus sp. IBL03825]